MTGVKLLAGIFPPLFFLLPTISPMCCSEKVSALKFLGESARSAAGCTFGSCVEEHRGVHRIGNWAWVRGGVGHLRDWMPLLRAGKLGEMGGGLRSPLKD